MLYVDGDDIICDNAKVGMLSGGWPTLRDLVRAAIEGAEPDMISESDHEEAIEEARKEGEENGKANAGDDLRDELEARKDEIYDEGFDAGRASAIVDMSRANDMERVEALLQAASVAHDDLFKVVHKRYPAAKQSELKQAAKVALTALRIAVNAYRKPNGADDE